jgi:acyl carrier protein
MASTQDKVVDIVAEQLGVDKDKITRESNFINDLGADSLDLVEMVMEFEVPVRYPDSGRPNGQDPNCRRSDRSDRQGHCCLTENVRKSRPM